MADFREEMYEVRATNENYYEDQQGTYLSLEWAEEAAADLRKEGFETEIYKLTVFEEFIG